MDIVNYLIISHTVKSGENVVLGIHDTMRANGFQNVVLAIRPHCTVDFNDLRTTIELTGHNSTITSVSDPNFDSTFYQEYRRPDAQPFGEVLTPDHPTHTYLLQTDGTKTVRSSFDGSEMQGIVIPNYKIGYSEDLDPRIYGVYDASQLLPCLDDCEAQSVTQSMIERGNPIIKLTEVLPTEIMNNSGDIKAILENHYFPRILRYHQENHPELPFNIIIFNCGSSYSSAQASSLSHDIVNQPGYMGGKVNYKKKYLKYKLKYLKLKQF